MPGRIDNRNSKYCQLGSSLVESTCGAILLFAVAALFLDFSIVLLAGNVTASVCRDAARSASRTVPDLTDRNSELKDTSPVFIAAQKAINDHAIPGQPWISRPTLESVIISGLKRHETEDVGGAIEGTVTVSCVMNLSMPVGLGGLFPDSMQFHKSFSFPITAVADVTDGASKVFEKQQTNTN